jgi:diguanylate cyclase (GGDEF)-like protein
MTSVHEPVHAFETRKSAVREVTQFGPREACLVHIYPKSPLLGRRYPLGSAAVLIGRNDDCQVQNTDSSVSRHHARIELRGEAYHVTDLGSTNGTFVNNTPRPQAPLEDGDYLRIGNCIYRFLAGGNIESEYHEEIYRLTVLDGLTGVPNRRHFEEFLDREVARAVRHRRSLALALLDIDHFKQVNDRLGHVAGDMTLRQVAATAAGVARRDELFARYGGEEFALVLPEADAAQAAAACERLRAAVAAHEFVFNKVRYEVTVSVGVGVTDGLSDVTPAELVRAADAQLYRAKATGRNRVCAPDPADRAG